MTLDDGVADDDFEIKQELFKKRGAEGMNLAEFMRWDIRSETMFTDTAVYIDLDDEEPSATIKRAKVKAEANDAVRVKKENDRQN